MALIGNPPTTSVDTLDGKTLLPPSEGWRNFFVAVFNICNALTMSGTTANRPATLLWVGRTYYDTTLALPIWYKGPGWVKADGTAA